MNEDVLVVGTGRNIDPDGRKLLRSMGASARQRLLDPLG